MIGLAEENKSIAPPFNEDNFQSEYNWPSSGIQYSTQGGMHLAQQTSSVAQQNQHSDDDLADDDQDEEGTNAAKRKQKRRSKNDVQGRDHKCTFCDKTYLSYPALYTHMKNKHAKGPDGQPLIAFNSGRGRGRPKKNAVGCRSHVEPTSSDFFKTIDKVGGPVEPIQGFDEVYTEIFIKRRTKKQEEEDGACEEGESGLQNECSQDKVGEKSMTTDNMDS